MKARKELAILAVAFGSGSLAVCAVHASVITWLICSPLLVAAAWGVQTLWSHP